MTDFTPMFTETKTLQTVEGNLTLHPPNMTKLQALCTVLPLGGEMVSDSTRGKIWGIIMKRGAREAYAMKQQPPNIPEKNYPSAFIYNSLLIALCFNNYKTLGFSGCFMPCPYMRSHGAEVETGIAYFCVPDPKGREVTDFPPFPTWDDYLGIGFSAIFTGALESIVKASQSFKVKPLPTIGLDIRPRSKLGTLGFGFLIHGQDIYCLKTQIDENDPVFPALRSTGITDIYHLPSVPLEIPE